MANTLYPNYDFKMMLSRYAAQDIFNAFQDGILPGDFRANNRYDELLHDEVFGFVFHSPLFQEWRDTLKLDPVCSAIRIGNACPEIATGYNLAIPEVVRLRRDGRVMLDFMKSMGVSLTNRALPYEEALPLSWMGYSPRCM